MQNYEEQLNKFKSLLSLVYEQDCNVIGEAGCDKALAVCYAKDLYRTKLSDDASIDLEGDYVLGVTVKVCDLVTLNELYSFANCTKIQARILKNAIIVLTGENTNIDRIISDTGELQYKVKGDAKPKETLYIIEDANNIRKVELKYYVDASTVIDHSICNRIVSALAINEHTMTGNKAAEMRNSCTVSNINGDIIAEYRSLRSLLSNPLEAISDDIIFSGARHEIIKIDNYIEANIIDRVKLKCTRRITYYPCRIQNENEYTPLMFMHIHNTSDIYAYNFDTKLIHRVKLDAITLNMSGIAKLLYDCTNTTDEERQKNFGELLTPRVGYGGYSIKSQIAMQKKLENKAYKKDLEDLSKCRLNFVGLTQIGPNECILGNIRDLVNSYKNGMCNDLESNIQMYKDSYGIDLEDTIDADRDKFTTRGTPYYIRSRQLKKSLFNNAFEIARKSERRYVNAISITDEIVTPSEIKIKHGFK